MKFIWKLAAAILANAAALWAGTMLISGFHVSTELKNLALAAVVLTGVNLIVKPFVKLILSPIIILTFGLAIIGINALMLYIMTQLMPNVVSIDNLATPAGLLTLFWATILTSLINIIVRQILK